MWPLPERSLPPLSADVGAAVQASLAHAVADGRAVEAIDLFVALARHSAEFRAMLDDAAGSAAAATSLLDRLRTRSPFTARADGREFDDEAKQIIFRCSSIAADAGEDRAAWRSMMSALLTSSEIVPRLRAESPDDHRPLDIALWDLAELPPTLSADTRSSMRHFFEIARHRTRGACGDFALVRKFESSVNVEFFASAAEAEAARSGTIVAGTTLAVHDDSPDRLELQVVMHVAS